MHLNSPVLGAEKLHKNNVPITNVNERTNGEKYLLFVSHRKNYFHNIKPIKKNKVIGKCTKSLNRLVIKK